MTKNEQTSKKRLELFKEVLQENDNFLFTKAKDTYDEVVELIIDAVDLVIPVAKQENWGDLYTRFSIIHFEIRILMPKLRY